MTLIVETTAGFRPPFERPGGARASAGRLAEADADVTLPPELATPAWVVALVQILLYRYTGAADVQLRVNGTLTAGRVSGQDTVVDVAARAGLELAEPATAAHPSSASEAAAGLRLIGRAEGDAMRVRVRYGSDGDTGAVVRRIADHLRQLAMSVAQRPDAPVGGLRLLTTEEEARIAGWSASELDSPQPMLVHELIEAQALRVPDAAAVVAGTAVHSYRELLAAAERWAGVLAVAGVRQGEIVGLYAERSFELVAAMIGILRAGAAYLPLDPAYPAERLAYMLSDSGTVVVATQRRLLDRLPAHEAGVRFVTAEDAAAEENTAETATAGKAATEAPAYVLYTSGSTGRPKGAVIPHRAVVNLLADLGPRFGLTARDVVLAQTPPSFDISVIELLLPLTLGARIHLIDRATAVDGTALAAEIDRTGATFVQGTPTTLRMLLASDWGGGDHITLLSGGEALPADVAAGLLRRCGRLWNGYGPTETAVYSLLAPIRPDEPIGIGTPLGGERAYVLDGDGNQVPIGVPGELHIGGDGLAHGYLGRPDLTAARFQPDPFDARPGRRMYQTGDLVRWREDGTMEFLGRLDHQVKVRGYRIELEEIESTLRGHASVRDAVVTVTGRDRALQAYLVLRPGTEPGRDDLHRHLARTLPDFMVPATFIAIDGLPVTPSGKIDRHAVAGLGGGRTLTATESAAPESTVEQVLAGVWLDLLETDDLSVTESVFAAGADSLLAMRAAQILHDVFRVPVPVRALFEHPSVRRQAAYLQTRSNRAATIANRLLDLAATASPSP